jgi:hypothetical protein
MLNWIVFSKDYGRQRPYEEGGSADSVPDTSSHRCRLLLPSDIYGPPFFEIVGSVLLPLVDNIPAGVSL